MNRAPVLGRISWVDAARGYGIFLVFLGHFLEELRGLQAPAAAEAFKFVYSFHMPLFFVLAGYTWKPRPLPAGRFFRGRVARRIVPYLVLNALIIPAWLLRDLYTGGPADNYGARLGLFVRGQGALDVPTWFLVCLFTLELIHALWEPMTRSMPRLLTSALLFLGGGLLVTQNIFAVAKFTGIAADFWYLHEALVAYGLFLIGVALRRSGLVDRQVPAGARAAAAAALFALVGATYSLNNGPFIFSLKPVVHMASSSHGNGFWFVLTALAGTLGVIGLAQLSARPALLQFVGRYSLVYMGFAGLFLQFLNAPLASWLQGMLPLAPLTTLGISLGVTLASLLACAPFAGLLQRAITRLADFAEGGPARATPAAGGVAAPAK